ncbi:MAG: DUF971 domain-containing protein [Azospirillaceae bacterium]
MPGAPSPTPWPREIRLRRADRVLVVDFDDGTLAELPAELLRVESPSAEVQGHSASQKKLVAGKRDVAITAVEPVGNYAVRLIFSDGHDTGFYSWDYLYQLNARREAVWNRYLEALSQAGMHRDG